MRNLVESLIVEKLIYLINCTFVGYVFDWIFDYVVIILEQVKIVDLNRIILGNSKFNYLFHETALMKVYL